MAEIVAAFCPVCGLAWGRAVVGEPCDDMAERTKRPPVCSGICLAAVPLSALEEAEAKLAESNMEIIRLKLAQAGMLALAKFSEKELIESKEEIARLKEQC